MISKIIYIYKNHPKSLLCLEIMGIILNYVFVIFFRLTYIMHFNRIYQLSNLSYIYHLVFDREIFYIIIRDTNILILHIHNS